MDQQTVTLVVAGFGIAGTHRNFGSRILVADELNRANIQERWRSAVTLFDGDLEKLNAEYENLRGDIVKIGIGRKV